MIAEDVCRLQKSRARLRCVRAANRLLVAEGPRGSIATFPPPHTFFFTREVDVNLGYVFYRNDGGGTYSIGVTMPEAEADTFPQYEQNYALYNAPPGTWQKMSMYFYASPEPAEATRQAAREQHLRITLQGSFSQILERTLHFGYRWIPRENAPVQHRNLFGLASRPSSGFRSRLRKVLNERAVHQENLLQGSS